MSRLPHSHRLRKGRWSKSGHVYFLTTSTYKRRPVFANRSNANTVMATVRWLHGSRRISVDAAVVMPDHLHLVGQLGDVSLDRLMHSLKSYSAHLIVKGGVSPPIWQDGFHDHGLRDEENYRARVTYTLENPVRAGLADSIESYPYLMLPDWWKAPM